MRLRDRLFAVVGMIGIVALPILLVRATVRDWEPQRWRDDPLKHPLVPVGLTVAAGVPLALLVRRTMRRVWRQRLFFAFVSNRIDMILEMQRRGLHADAERHRAAAARLVAEYQADPVGFLSRWKLPCET
jgi:hypothetical protein